TEPSSRSSSGAGLYPEPSGSPRPRALETCLSSYRHPETAPRRRRSPAMTTSNDQPHVTFQDGCWQGTWQDGYTVIVRAIDMRRVGVCRVELEVRYQNKYVAPFGVDLLDSRSREAFAIAMGARNGVAAVTWDD